MDNFDAIGGLPQFLQKLLTTVGAELPLCSCPVKPIPRRPNLAIAEPRFWLSRTALLPRCATAQQCFTGTLGAVVVFNPRSNPLDLIVGVAFFGDFLVNFPRRVHHGGVVFAAE